MSMAKLDVDYSIYLVTDNDCIGARNLLECVEQALRGGVTVVQYRSKYADGGKMYAEALELKALCDNYQVPLIINDRVDVALAVGAAGVHVGQDDLPCRVVRELTKAVPDFLVGVSCHNPEEALQALADGADYLGCGAVFGSSTKSNVNTLGLQNLEAIHRALAAAAGAGEMLHMVGIGGINAGNYGQVLATGADGAAIVSGILAAENIKAEVEKFVQIRNNC